MFGKKVPLISASELFDRMKNSPKKLFLVDIRKPIEWVGGIIPGSNMMSDESFKKKIKAGSLTKDLKNKQVVVICKSGNRSGKIAKFLLKSKEVEPSAILNMQGGIIAWQQNGFPVSRPVD